MYLGAIGSGKSFAAKRELLKVFLTIPLVETMTYIVAVHGEHLQSETIIA